MNSGHESLGSLSNDVEREAVKGCGCVQFPYLSCPLRAHKLIVSLSNSSDCGDLMLLKRHLGSESIGELHILIQSDVRKVPVEVNH